MNNMLIIKEQHGFRSGASCQTLLVEFRHDLAISLDSGEKIVGVFSFYFCKAFNKIDHQLLLYKLKKKIRIDYDVLMWLKEYFNGRTQCVVLNEKRSAPESVWSGVPQDSVLGPLLFLTYINDITLNINSHIKLFAGDCDLYRTIYEQADNIILQEHLNSIVQWCREWKTTFNPTKSKLAQFSRKFTFQISFFITQEMKQF